MAVLVALLGGTGHGVRPAIAASGTSYHVDCNAGRDSADGTTPGTAWRGLARASAAPLRPGDSLLLARGCRWKGPLTAGWSGTLADPVTVGAYGTGELPIIENSVSDIEVTGSYLVIEDVHVRADPPSHDTGCDSQRAGFRFGVRFVDPAHHDLVRRSLFTELFTGVQIREGAHHIAILDNEFRNNDMKSEDPRSDSGAVGIDVVGDDNEIAYNRISGSDACSRFYDGRDGSAISIYGGRRNVIHHNVTFANHDFIEVGQPRSANNLIAYNRDYSTARQATWAVVHGDGSRNGPVSETHIYHNTVVMTGSLAYAVQCTATCSPDILSLRANIIWAEDRIGHTDGSFDEGDNLYWRSDGDPKIFFPTSPTSRIADPRLIDPFKRDFRLLPDSPAIDAAGELTVDGTGGVDLDGVKVPQGFGPDIGAYEFVPVPDASPGPGESPIPGSSPGTPPGSGAPTAVPTPGPTIPPLPPTADVGQGGPGLLLPAVLGLGALGGAAILWVRRRPV